MIPVVANLQSLAFLAHPEPMWVTSRGDGDAGGRLRDVNAAALATYGYAREEFLQLRACDLEVGSTPVVRPGNTAARTAWHRRRDGTPFEVELQDEDIEHQGEAARLVLARDLSTWRALESERALWRAKAVEARDMLRDMFDRVTDGIGLFDAQRRYRYMNDRLAQMLGVATADELVGLHIWERFPDRIGSAFHTAFETVLGERRSIAVEDRFEPTGRWFDTRLHPLPDGGVVVYSTDVTDRRAAEQAATAARQEWQLLAEQVPAISYRTQAQPPYRPLWVSPRLADLGYDLQAWMDDPLAFQRAVHPDDLDDMYVQAEQALRTRGEFDLQYRMCGADGRWHHMRDIARLVSGPDGRGRFLQGVIVDVTVQREAEAALGRSRQQLAALAQRLMEQEKGTTRRVAQVLHDSVGQTLAVARLHQDALVRTLEGVEEPVRAAAQQVAALLAQAVLEVRQVLVGLRPPLLDDHGLVAALEHEVAALQRAPGGGMVRLDIRPDAHGLRWPAAVEHGAFMIAREALTNALRHAEASWIRVVLAGNADMLTLDVDDDGVGIAPAAMSGRAGHLGITGMSERASAVGAQLDVERRRTGGTRVSLRWKSPGR